MASMFRLPYRLSRQLFSWRPFFQRPASPVRDFSQVNFPLLDSTEKLEEETLSWYLPDGFYPVRIGEVFQSRYQVIGKLGFGGYSTIWLCRDLQQHAYVTLKVFECDSAEGKRETEVYEHLNSLRADHAGRTLVRKALDSFQITAGQDSFRCLKKIVKLTLIHVLLAIEFLHTEAGVIHTDIQEKNIMLGIDDPSILPDFEEEEKPNASPRKVVEHRVIYASRKLKKTKQHGRPTLCDFGQARMGSILTPGKFNLIFTADIWNIGVLTWDLFQQGHLFYARDSERRDSDAHHLAELIAIFGPPPKEMLQRSVYAAEFFDSEGNWKAAAEIPPISLEKLEGNLEGAPQQLFLQFLRRMLKWRPEERESASDLLCDPWLQSP
ncbi:kinase-like protein [Aspergillus aurantiobrunneus]